MAKTFDESCEFINDPNDFFEATKKFESEKVKVRAGNHICLIHPCCIRQCEKLTGSSYEDLFANILNEITIRHLFEIYGEPFSRDMIEDALETAANDVIAYLQNVKEGKYKNAKTYENMIKVINGNLPEPLV